MKVFIISLEISQDRRERIADQLNRLNIEFEIVTAVNGKDNPSYPLFQKYNAKKHLLLKGRNLTLPELGCYASHYMMWQKCVELDQPIMILEDDANILPTFATFYRLSDAIMNRYDLIWLHKSARKNQYTILKKLDGFDILRAKKEYICATGYVLTVKAAKAFIQHTREWTIPVDDAMAQFYLHGVESITINPPCIEEGIGISTIDASGQNRKRKQRSIVTKLGHELYNLYLKIRRSLHNYKYDILNRKK